MTAWLGIVGIGETGIDSLGAAARTLVETAEVLVGGERHLAMIPEDERERLAWPSPFDALIEDIEKRRGRRVCVLATGDPMCYGVGAILARHFALDDLTIIPAPSAFSLACARLGWSCTEVESLSVHGRPLEVLLSHLQPGAKLLVLAHDRETPGRIATMLRERGYGESPITVLEYLGGPRERLVSGRAARWSAATVADFHTLAIECAAAPDAKVLPRTPGLSDDAFQHDGQITKREVRAVTLAKLCPVPGQLLWDVGAGCGSVSVEWMRSARRARAVAVERSRERLPLIAANASALGTPTLQVVEGHAPEALRGLEAPDAVFIGGGITADGLFEQCWQSLKPGGRLVANGVTLEAEQAFALWRTQAGGELVRFAVSRASPVGGFTGWRPQMNVTQFSAVKP